MLVSNVRSLGCNEFADHGLYSFIWGVCNGFPLVTSVLASLPQQTTPSLQIPYVIVSKETLRESPFFFSFAPLHPVL